MKKILIANLIGLISIFGYGFTPPSGNTTVMVNNSNVLVSPTATQLIDANPELSDYFKINGWQVNIDTTPSVNPIDGYQTQYKTLEINTPYTDLSDILLGKLNRGALNLDGGTATTSAVNAVDTFSLCATLGADFAGVFTFGSLTFTASSNTLTISDGSNTMTASLSATKTQTLVFVQTSTTSKLYIDGELIASDMLTFTSGTFAITGGTGQISRIKIFNIDISDASSVYTLTDYQNGSDEPPSIKGGSVIYSGNPPTTDFTSYKYGMGDVDIAFTYEDGYLCCRAANSGTLSNQYANCGAIYSTGRTYPAGTKVRIKYDDWVVDDTLWLVQAAGAGNAYGKFNFTYNVAAAADYLNSKDYEFTLTGNLSQLVLRQSSQKLLDAGLHLNQGDLIWKIKNLQIWVDGVLLSLADFTLNGTVLDFSGNENNATVSGAIAGTNDAAVGALYEAFTGSSATLTPISYVPTVSSFYDALRAAVNADGTAYTTQYQYEDDTIILTEWTDAEFKVLDSDGNLIYWVSTQWGAQMGTDYTTNPASDLNAKIFYTSPENEANGTGKGREWIQYVHNDVNARTIYEHAQGITGSATPTIGGIIIQPNFSGTTYGGTSIQSIFGKNVLDAPTGNQFIYLKASPTNLEKTKTSYPIWRTIRPNAIQGGN